jgi:hypothetical protein
MCSLVRRCTPVLRTEKATMTAQQREEVKTLTRFDVFLVEADRSYT